LVDLPFSPLFWELILGKVPQFSDIAKIDTTLYNSVQDLRYLLARKEKLESDETLDEETLKRSLNLLKIGNDATLEDLCLTFVLPGTKVELKPSGNELSVTLDNLEEYLDLLLKSLFVDTISA
jgi:E3 ubiquitin-protein ligase TRIP12